MTAPHTNSASYEVGYGKPPRHTQFKKGQSGNPGGRPRGRTAGVFGELVLQEAYRGVIVMERGVAVPMPAIQAVLRSQFELAAAGNVKAQRAVLAMMQDLDQEDGPDLRGTVSEDDGDDGGGADHAGVHGGVSDDGGADSGPARPDDEGDPDDDRRQETLERDAEQPPVERWRLPPAPEPPPPPVRAWRDRPRRPGADLRRAWRESGGRDRW
jgi:hypothetical protein